MPPALELFNAYNGDWAAYEDALFNIFLNDIAQAELALDGIRVSCRRIPEERGRWASFWHLVQEGRVEDDREPDLRRCERIRWVRWVIVNAANTPNIERWENTRGTENNVLLWYNEEYLVVLSRRSTYWLLKTAYCTERSGRISQLRKERDAYLAANQ